MPLREVRLRVEQGADGSWAINNRGQGISYFRDSSVDNLNVIGRGGDGVIQSALVGASGQGDGGPSKIRQFMDYTIMIPFDMLGGIYDVAKNYYDMRKLNLINSDKYFHAKANFQATRRGPGGAFIAIRFSNLREIIDQRVKGDSWFDSMEDQRANIYGRRLGWEYRYYEGTIDYSEILKTFWHEYFPEGY